MQAAASAVAVRGIPLGFNSVFHRKHECIFLRGELGVQRLDVLGRHEPPGSPARAAIDLPSTDPTATRPSNMAAPVSAALTAGTDVQE